MTNLNSILKSRDITLSTKVHLVKATVFPAVMYGCESWAVKKAECRKIDAFELWCWRRLLTVPWTARRSNQFILNEISPGCSLEGLMLKLKLQYFGHLMPLNWTEWTNKTSRYLECIMWFDTCIVKGFLHFTGIDLMDTFIVVVSANFSMEPWCSTGQESCNFLHMKLSRMVVPRS